MKLLVTSDYSENSIAAIKFAQTLLKQTPSIDVIFYHAIHIVRPGFWEDSLFQEHQGTEIARLEAELEKFVCSVLGDDQDQFRSMEFIVDNCPSTAEQIPKIAEQHHADFICMATQGAGLLRSILGTHTSYVVDNSNVPTFVVPSDWQAQPLRNITYLTDFENLDKEVETVTGLADSIAADVKALHFSSIELDEDEFARKTQLFETGKFSKIQLTVSKDEPGTAIVERIATYVKSARPDLLLMFTAKEKSLLERIFLPSISSSLSYSTEVPALIFPK